jgi:hypothetical protein
MAMVNWLQHIGRKIRDDVVSGVVRWLLLALLLAVLVWFGLTLDDNPQNWAKVAADAAGGAVRAIRIWLMSEAKPSHLSLLLLIVGVLLANAFALVAFLRLRQDKRSAQAETDSAAASTPSEASATPQAPAVTEQQAPAFQQFAVIDSKHQLEWHVVDDPETWIKGRSSEWDEEHIEGPFHSDPDCRAKLGSIYTPHSNYLATDPKCPHCRKLLFSGRPFVTVSARGDVAEELRRMRRRGEAIGPGAILTHADYWKGISPAVK